MVHTHATYKDKKDWGIYKTKKEKSVKNGEF